MPASPDNGHNYYVDSRMDVKAIPSAQEVFLSQCAIWILILLTYLSTYLPLLSGPTRVGMARWSRLGSFCKYQD